MSTFDFDKALEASRKAATLYDTPAAPLDLDDALNATRRAAELYDGAVETALPPNVAAVARSPLPSTLDPRPEASTPESDGIPTRTSPLPPISNQENLRQFQDQSHVFMRGAVEGIPIAGPALRRGADRVAAGINSRLGGADPEAELRAIQERGDKLTKEMPGTHLAGSIAGGTAVLGPLVAASPTLFGLNASTATRAAATGAATNAVIGALDAIVREAIDKGEVDPGNVARSAGINAAGGALGGVLGRAVGRRAGVAASRDPIEHANVDELHGLIARRAQANYTRAEAAGFNVSSRDFNTFTNRLSTKLTDEAGYAANLNPTIATALQNTRGIAGSGNVTLKQLDSIRQQFGNIASNFTNPGEQRLAGIAIRQLDDFVRAQPDDGASKAITEARRLWHVRSKVSTVSNALSNVEFSAGNPLSAVRTAFRPLLRNNAKALTRSGFTRDEISEVRRLYRASSVDEMLQVVNRAGPSSVITLGIGAVTGFATGSIHAGLGTSAALAAGSRVAGAAAQSRVQSAAENVLRSLARGTTQKPMSMPAGNLAAQFGIQSGAVGNERRRVGR